MIPDCTGCVICSEVEESPVFHSPENWGVPAFDTGGHFFIEYDNYTQCEFCEVVVPEEWRGVF